MQIRLSVQFSSVAQSCPTFCDPMNRSTPGLPVHHQLPEFTQTHAYWVSDAIQPSHPLSSPSPPAFVLSQHQGLFKWVNASHQVAKVLEFQFQHQWMIPKAYLTSHSRMSGSRWVITPSWLSGSWSSILYSSSVYSCHLFLISSASVRSIPFLSFIEPIFAWNDPLVSNFLEEISSLSHSIVFLFLCTDCWGRLYLSLLFFGTLHSDAYIFPFLLCFSLPFFS